LPVRAIGRGDPRVVLVRDLGVRVIRRGDAQVVLVIVLGVRVIRRGDSHRLAECAFRVGDFAGTVAD